MKRFYAFIGIILFTSITMGLVPASAVYQVAAIDPVTLSGSGWTITANPELGVFSLAHDSLGLVMKEIRLNLKSKQGLSPLKDWTAEKKGERQLTVRTVLPGSTWIFELNQNNVIISCTSSDMLLTAEAPASAERVIARLLDPRGVPVEWTGTNEITDSWNGNDTRNPSYLAVKNTEIMTFALGQVSASNLNSLFDRKVDIVLAP